MSDLGLKPVTFSHMNLIDGILFVTLAAPLRGNTCKPQGLVESSDVCTNLCGPMHSVMDKVCYYPFNYSNLVSWHYRPPHFLEEGSWSFR